MPLSRLILQELAHRRLHFAVAAAITAAAVACVVAVVGILASYQGETRRQLTQHQSDSAAMLATYRDDVEARGREWEDAARKITKGLGFNVTIIPEAQGEYDFALAGYATQTMPEEYVDRLASMDIITVDHLLPMLERAVTWPEQNNRQFILVGIRGEVPLKGTDPKKPLQQPVPEGEIYLGSLLAKELNLSKGDEVLLMGRSFKVGLVYPPRKIKEDITAWVPLNVAQTMLGEAGRINAILALNCNCESADMLAEVPREIESAMPGVKVIMHVDEAVTRAQTRKQATAEAVLALRQAEANQLGVGQGLVRQRAALERRAAAFAAVLVPLVVLAGGVAVGLLAWANVRDRRGEIGILRAIGVRSMQVLGVFLGKAVLVGLTGAVVGVTVGLIIGWADAGEAMVEVSRRIWPAALAALGLAPLVCVLATWLPALIASQQDPAGVLREG